MFRAGAQQAGEGQTPGGTLTGLKSLPSKLALGKIIPDIVKVTEAFIVMLHATWPL